MPIDNETRNQIDLAIYAALKENPRIATRELFRIIASLRKWKILHGSAQQILDKLFKDKILIGPYLYRRSGTKVTISEKKDIDAEELRKRDSFGISLVGQYSYLGVSQDGPGNLQYAELVGPSVPPKIVLEKSLQGEGEFIDHCFDRPQKLESDRSVEWDSIDWRIYEAMRNPRQNFFEVGTELSMPWKMVRERFQRIVKDCKVFMGFFPLGYLRYDHLLVTMRTEYETGIEKFLQGLDRSSWLLKVDDILVLYLFHTHINLTCLKFSEMNCMGIIDDVRVGFPVNVDRERVLFF